MPDGDFDPAVQVACLLGTGTAVHLLHHGVQDLEEATTRDLQSLVFEHHREFLAISGDVRHTHGAIHAMRKTIRAMRTSVATIAGLSFVPIAGVPGSAEVARHSAAMGGFGGGGSGGGVGPPSISGGLSVDAPRLPSAIKDSVSCATASRLWVASTDITMRDTDSAGPTGGLGTSMRRPAAALPSLAPMLAALGVSALPNTAGTPLIEFMLYMSDTTRQLLALRKYKEAYLFLLVVDNEAGKRGCSTFVISLVDLVANTVSADCRSLPPLAFNLHEPLIALLVDMGRTHVASSIFLRSQQLWLVQLLDRTLRHGDEVHACVKAVDVTISLIQHTVARHRALMGSNTVECHTLVKWSVDMITTELTSTLLAERFRLAFSNATNVEKENTVAMAAASTQYQRAHNLSVQHRTATSASRANSAEPAATTDRPPLTAARPAEEGRAQSIPPTPLAAPQSAPTLDAPPPGATPAVPGASQQTQPAVAQPSVKPSKFGFLKKHLLPAAVTAGAAATPLAPPTGAATATLPGTPRVGAASLLSQPSALKKRTLSVGLPPKPTAAPAAAAVAPASGHFAMLSALRQSTRSQAPFVDALKLAAICAERVSRLEGICDAVPLFVDALAPCLVLLVKQHVESVQQRISVITLLSISRCIGLESLPSQQQPSSGQADETMSVASFRSAALTTTSTDLTGTRDVLCDFLLHCPVLTKHRGFFSCVGPYLQSQFDIFEAGRYRVLYVALTEAKLSRSAVHLMEGCLSLLLPRTANPGSADTAAGDTSSATDDPFANDMMSQVVLACAATKGAPGAINTAPPVPSGPPSRTPGFGSVPVMGRPKPPAPSANQPSVADFTASTPQRVTFAAACAGALERLTSHGVVTECLDAGLQEFVLSYLREISEVRKELQRRACVRAEGEDYDEDARSSLSSSDGGDDDASRESDDDDEHDDASGARKAKRAAAKLLLGPPDEDTFDTLSFLSITDVRLLASVIAVSTFAIMAAVVFPLHHGGQLAVHLSRLLPRIDKFIDEHIDSMLSRRSPLLRQLDNNVDRGRALARESTFPRLRRLVVSRWSFTQVEQHMTKPVSAFLQVPASPRRIIGRLPATISATPVTTSYTRQVDFALGELLTRESMEKFSSPPECALIPLIVRFVLNIKAVVLDTAMNESGPFAAARLGQRAVERVVQDVLCRQQFWEDMLDVSLTTGTKRGVATASRNDQRLLHDQVLMALCACLVALEPVMTATVPGDGGWGTAAAQGKGAADGEDDDPGHLHVDDGSGLRYGRDVQTLFTRAASVIGDIPSSAGRSPPAMAASPDDERRWQVATESVAMSIQLILHADPQSTALGRAAAAVSRFSVDVLSKASQTADGALKSLAGSPSTLSDSLKVAAVERGSLTSVPAALLPSAFNVAVHAELLINGVPWKAASIARKGTRSVPSLRPPGSGLTQQSLEQLQATTSQAADAAPTSCRSSGQGDDAASGEGHDTTTGAAPNDERPPEPHDGSDGETSPPHDDEVAPAGTATPSRLDDMKRFTLASLRTTFIEAFGSLRLLAVGAPL